MMPKLRPRLFAGLCLPLALSLPLAAAPAKPRPSAAAKAEAPPIAVTLDASDVGSKLLRVKLEIPAAPGPLTLVYPKWIPGEHGPTGPIANLVDLRFKAGGKEVPWERDPVDMFQHHLKVPAGAGSVVAEASFLYLDHGALFSAGPGATPWLAVINWNSVLLYPAGATGDSPTFTPTLILPKGWTAATALTREGRSDETGRTIRFAPVSLTNLIDSPVLAGAYQVDLNLGQHRGVPHTLSLAADREQDIATAQELKAPMIRMIEEAHALFGARHYDSYRWLLALSDHVEHFGLEHHQSSDNRVDEDALLNDAKKRSLFGLLAHEYVHSWNAKYRRPEGLLSPDFQKPMQGALLWTYEGLTQHLGLLLPARAGIWTDEHYRDTIALIGASLDVEPGRSWRSLGDTATAAQILFQAGGEGRARRRGTDFYDESVFLWLDVDSLLREKSGGKVSLDDFLQRFHGGADSGPAVLPYTRADLVKTLNDLVPLDWDKVFADRVDRPLKNLSFSGVERAGWRLVYNDKPNSTIEDREERFDGHNWFFSLGFEADDDGVITELLPDSPSGKAGMTDGQKILGVAGYVFSGRAVEAAILDAKKAKDPIEFIVQQGDAIRTYKVDYHDGPRFPHLERIEGKPDMLADILRARAATAK